MTHVLDLGFLAFLAKAMHATRQTLALVNAALRWLGHECLLFNFALKTLIHASLFALDRTLIAEARV